MHELVSSNQRKLQVRAVRPAQKENPKSYYCNSTFPRRSIRCLGLSCWGSWTPWASDRLAAQHRFFSCDPERTAREANPSHERCAPRRLSVTPPVHSCNGGSIQALCQGLLGQGTLKQPELVMIKLQCSIYADDVILFAMIKFFDARPA